MSPTVRQVGIDIQESEDNRALIEAIKADNPDLTIRHMPGLVKLQSAGQIVINRQTVEEKLGRDWETGEFQVPRKSAPNVSTYPLRARSNVGSCSYPKLRRFARLAT